MSRRDEQDGPTLGGDLHHLAAAYALDALDDDERRRFEAHYPDCEMCRQEVREFGETTANLAAATATPAPPALRDRVLAEVATVRQVSPRTTGEVTSLAGRRPRRWAGLSTLAAAAAVIVLVVGLVVAIGSRGAGSELDDVIAAPDAVVTALAGESGTVRVVWSPARAQVAVFANDLPAAGRGRVYELWALAATGPIPAGLFEPDDGTVRAVLDLGDVDPDGWGVTIEPAGGSPQPTGEILFAADV